jgi:hypothetical protein
MGCKSVCVCFPPCVFRSKEVRKSSLTRCCRFVCDTDEEPRSKPTAAAAAAAAKKPVAKKQKQEYIGGWVTTASNKRRLDNHSACHRTRCTHLVRQVPPVLAMPADDDSSAAESSSENEESDDDVRISNKKPAAKKPATKKSTEKKKPAAEPKTAKKPVATNHVVKASERKSTVGKKTARDVAFADGGMSGSDSEDDIPLLSRKAPKPTA